MELYLIVFQSDLHKKTPVRESRKELFAEMEKHFVLHVVPHTEARRIPKDAYQIAFIASGGVERTVTRHFDLLPYPIHLLTDGLYNSLSASLEAAAWIHSKGMKVHIIHGSIPHMVKQLRDHYRVFSAHRELQGKRIGVVGHPSPWLVASDVDYLLAKRRWGVEFIDIPMEEAYCLFYQIDDDAIGYEASVFAGRAAACREASPDDLLKAMRLYRAMQILCRKKALDAVTLSCFSVIDTLHTTGCLALSLLNDEGIPAGCEGDLQSVFTLLVAKTLTGKSGFMANISLIDEERNDVVMAHCTVSTQLTDRFVIRSHFESNGGLALQGTLPPGTVTLLKCAGECLDEYAVSTGRLIENTHYNNICRTQVRIQLDKPVACFLNTPLGNHHIVLPGDQEKVINEFMELNSCKLVE